MAFFTARSFATLHALSAYVVAFGHAASAGSKCRRRRRRIGTHLLWSSMSDFLLYWSLHFPFELSKPEESSLFRFHLMPRWWHFRFIICIWRVYRFQDERSIFVAHCLLSWYSRSEIFSSFIMQKEGRGDTIEYTISIFMPCKVYLLAAFVANVDYCRLPLGDSYWVVPSRSEVSYRNYLYVAKCLSNISRYIADTSMPQSIRLFTFSAPRYHDAARVLIIKEIFVTLIYATFKMPAG